MKREDDLCRIIKGMQVASQNNVKPLLLAESTMTQGLPKNEVALGKGRAFLCFGLACTPASCHRTKKTFCMVGIVLTAISTHNAHYQQRRYLDKYTCRKHHRHTLARSYHSLSSFVLTTDSSPVAGKNSFNASGVKYCNQKGAKGPFVYFQVCRNTLLQRPLQPSAFCLLLRLHLHAPLSPHPPIPHKSSFFSLSIASILSPSHWDIAHHSTNNNQLPHRYVGGAQVRRGWLHRKRHQSKQPLPFLQAEFLLVPFRE